MATARPPRTRSPRLVARALAGSVAGLLAALPLVAGAGAADAADGYRYWNYFHVSDGRYVFAQTGPGAYQPKDGAVEGYRYGLSSAADGISPRTAATTYSIADICGTRKAASGQKRVGVLIDYGTEADSGEGDTVPGPRTACAVVPATATGLQVLDEVAEVRVEKQLTCGIDGYPARGCSTTVKNAPPPAPAKQVPFSMPTGASSGTPAAGDDEEGGGDEAADDTGGGGLSWPVVGAAVAGTVLAGGALFLSRRSTSA